MTVRFPLATSSWDDAELAALQRVIASDRYSMGQEVARFEREFAAYTGSRFAVMVNSGSSANLVMVAALRYTQNKELRLEPGDEVIVPAVSWSTTFYPLHQYGLKMKFVDIDLDTLNYDLKALEEAVTDRTRAIMAVNLLGNPNDFDRIRAIIGERDIVLIEDNCESMGATFQGRQAGTFGVMGTYSSFFSHHISTMEGGLVVTDDEELYHVLLALRAHGWTRNLPKNNHVTGEKSDDPFEESFRFVLPGYNLRPLEMSGALGLEQLKKLPELIKGRQANGQRFVEAMRDHPVFRVQQETGNSSWFGFALIIRPEPGLTRRQVIDRFDELGFETRPIVSGNFTKNPVLQMMDHSLHGQMTNADNIDRNGFFIGNHHYDFSEAIDTVKAFRA
ncbi:DegT/DnrJ/EryC1/StrS family aminotransferase [Paracoccus seriniphilus]|uniref:CDP-6-deoxy-D-xylo-4-hexulose-3-dehydrase n=1 Tax=Paracoccus seriniphilus TaxID=184748 RepID=A0A239Q229_9RHOB|nr:DegT/DnrJ/EryC1/StrS family aminotransferase [Paracoccus seriniphilus]WCR16130.1 DegT/DnrJ/EryC1/StrS family aminotransferase [Paracoccus seriniphilus]SNT76252.1 CDP-6-deoxy-D-xylo-4-hexulose-3-dehydrase [Paracoccus seriniphilus]